MSFSFRITFKLPEGQRFEHDENLYSTKDESLPKILIKSAKDDQNIEEASEILFISHGYNSYEEAEEKGERILNSLIRSFVKMRKGFNYGLKGERSFITDYGLEFIKKQTGHERVLRGKLGLVVYETKPKPVFANMNAKATVKSPIQKIEKTLVKAENNYRKLDERELLSADLFSASTFQRSKTTRFLLLVMAVEVLVEKEEKSEPAKELISNFIEVTDENPKIGQHEKKSLLGSLNWLKYVSVRQGCKSLIKDILAEKEYENMPAEKFFDKCYSIRSNLTHGNLPFPDRKVIGKYVAPLEELVSDLLTNDF